MTIKVLPSFITQLKMMIRFFSAGEGEGQISQLEILERDHKVQFLLLANGSKDFAQPFGPFGGFLFSD